MGVSAPVFLHGIHTQAYEEMPIEEFGKAMLRGMGWSEGMGVGRNRKQVSSGYRFWKQKTSAIGCEPSKRARVARYRSYVCTHTHRSKRSSVETTDCSSNRWAALSVPSHHLRSVC
eukprot:1154872-Pelagomonas_calceolata.AAC.5